MESSALTCHFAPVFSAANKHKSPQAPTQPEGFPALPTDWVVEFETIPRGITHLFAHLFRSNSPAEPNAHKAIIALHGQGEHSGRYMHLPHSFRDIVGSIYAFDHRGHGQSSGNRGHIDHFDEYAEDAAFAIGRYTQYLKNRYGKAEIHLVAHSMGGLIALRMLQLHPDLELASVTVTSPMIDLAFKVPKIKDFAARFLNKIMPSLSIPGEPLGDLVSRDPAVVTHYKTDPLNHGLASPAFYLSYLDTKKLLWAHVKDFKHPMLFLVPTDDKIIDPGATLTFFDEMVAPEKKKIVYKGLYHEVMNEPEKEDVMKAIHAWIVQHSAKS
ncbi:MAG: lysophospholipase [Chitinophagaceae bacterium]|nr:lysophospholipase [Oligoflexus sp.]